MAPTPTPPHERVLRRCVQQDDGCLVFQGSLNRGYGRVTVWEGPPGQRRPRVHQSHRLVYEALVGPIPDDMTIDHLCSNKACQNVDHMEVVTREENTRRGATRRWSGVVITHCPQGHEYTPDNTRIVNGSKACRECGRKATLRWYHERGGKQKRKARA